MFLPPLLAKKPPPPALNCVPSSRQDLDRVKRDLFGAKNLSPEAKEQLLQECHEHAEQSNRVRFGYTHEFGPNQRWNFDFENCEPLQADNVCDMRYRWEQVVPATFMPLIKRHRFRESVSPTPSHHNSFLPLAGHADRTPTVPAHEGLLAVVDGTVQSNLSVPLSVAVPCSSSPPTTPVRHVQRIRQTTLHDYARMAGKSASNPDVESRPSPLANSTAVSQPATPTKIRRQPSRRVEASAARPITDYFPVVTGSTTHSHRHKRPLTTDDSASKAEPLTQKPVTPQPKEKRTCIISATTTPTTRSRTLLTRRLMCSASSAIVDDSSNSCSNDAAFSVIGLDEADADRVRRCLKYTPPKMRPRGGVRRASAAAVASQAPDAVDVVMRSCTPTSGDSGAGMNDAELVEEDEIDEEEDDIPLFATPVPASSCGSATLSAEQQRRRSQTEMSPSLLYSPSSKCMH